MVLPTNCLPCIRHAHTKSGTLQTVLTNHSGIMGPPNFWDTSSKIIPRPEIPPATNPAGSKKFCTPTASKAVPDKSNPYCTKLFCSISFAVLPKSSLFFLLQDCTCKFRQTHHTPPSCRLCNQAIKPLQPQFLE